MYNNPKRQYQDILVYNELKSKSDDNSNKSLTDSLSNLMAVYDRLYNYGFSLAGYQFIGLAVSSINQNVEWIDQFAFFILSVGFVISVFSSLLSFCMYEYINGIKLESNEFIISGLHYYRFYLFIPHPLLLCNTAIFIIPFNILTHNMLLKYFAVALNGISIILCFGFWIHWRMIVMKQEYPSIRHLHIHHATTTASVLPADSTTTTTQSISQRNKPINCLWCWESKKPQTISAGYVGRKMNEPSVS